MQSNKIRANSWSAGEAKQLTHKTWPDLISFTLHSWLGPVTSTAAQQIRNWKMEAVPGTTYTPIPFSTHQPIRSNQIFFEITLVVKMHIPLTLISCPAAFSPSSASLFPSVLQFASIHRDSKPVRGRHRLLFSPSLLYKIKTFRTVSAITLYQRQT